MIQARARTDTGLPLAVPTRAHSAIVQAAEDDQVPLAHEGELLDELRERDRVRARRDDVLVLVERGQGRLLATAEAEGPVAEDALAVDEVADHLPEAPLAFGVPVALLLGRHRREEPSDRVDLALEDGQDVRLGHERHVPGVEGRVLRLGRPLGHWLLLRRA